jgi:integrase
MEYLEGKPYETAYAPFTINKQGKAYTYDSFYGKFQEIIRDEITPILLADEDAEIVLYGRMLLEHKLSPHIFRHWYTVQLVLSGINEPGVLMTHRGDSSPDSALTYIKNKSELQKQFKKVNNETFNYLSWLAKKRCEK